MQNPIISDHKNLVTPTLYHMQNTTSKVLSSGMLSSEERLFWVFSKYSNYILKTITSLYKVDSYSFSKANDACSLSTWSQTTAGGEQGYLLG